MPDISLLVVNQVQVCDGGALCDDYVKQYPVPNDEHNVQKIGYRKEVIRPLGVQHVRQASGKTEACGREAETWGTGRK